MQILRLFGLVKLDKKNCLYHPTNGKMIAPNVPIIYKISCTVRVTDWSAMPVNAKCAHLVQLEAGLMTRQVLKYCLLAPRSLCTSKH